jgi:hypothetical protein
VDHIHRRSCATTASRHCGCAVLPFVLIDVDRLLARITISSTGLATHAECEIDFEQLDYLVPTAIDVSYHNVSHASAHCYRGVHVGHCARKIPSRPKTSRPEKTSISAVAARMLASSERLL